MNEKKQIEELSEFFYHVDGTSYRGGPIRVVNYDALALALYDAGYRKQSEWISVDERLPELYGAYLTHTFRGYIKISHFEEWVIGEKPSFDDYTVTHWMPLPEPPETIEEAPQNESQL